MCSWIRSESQCRWGVDIDEFGGQSGAKSERWRRSTATCTARTQRQVDKTVPLSRLECMGRTTCQARILLEG